MKQHATSPKYTGWKRTSARYWQRVPAPDRERLAVLPCEPPCTCSPKCKGASA